MKRRKPKTMLSENTHIRIGLVIVIITVLLSWVWWAATINAKIDTILQFQQSQDSSLTTLKRDMENLRRDFEVHKASTIQ